MAHALDVSMPMLDYRIVKFANRLLRRNDQLGESSLCRTDLLDPAMCRPFSTTTETVPRTTRNSPSR